MRRGLTFALRPSPERLAVLVALVLVVYFGVAAARPFYRTYQLQREGEALELEVVALQQEHERLEAELAQRQSLAYVEKVAREELNLVKPGDWAVIVVSAPSAAMESAAVPVEAAAPPQPSNWAQWWDYLFGPR